VHFFQVFLVKPAGGGELGVYHEESWMPGKNAMIASLERRAGLPRTEVDLIWIAVSHRPATLAVRVTECVENAHSARLSSRNGIALLYRFETQRAFFGSIPQLGSVLYLLVFTYYD
jgi:hypothetical protein